MASATKQALLAALSAAQGECISGQQLARQLGVSRAAVHKAAAALAAQGYALEAAPPAGLSAGGRRPLLRRGVGEYEPPSTSTTSWKAPTARQSCWRWMVHPMARWCSPPTRAPDAAGWAGDLKARQAGNKEQVIAYADKGSERLRRRFRQLLYKGKQHNVIKTAIARELSCFIWGMMTDRIA